MTEIPERQEIITRDEHGQPTALATLPPGSMAQFLPKSVSELAHVAKFAADVGMFGVTRQGVAFNIMLAGAHLGLTPYASLEGITLINGRPVVSAQVQWTLILSRGQVTDYTIDSTDEHCEITVRSRKWREPKSQRVTKEDVPRKLANKDTYVQHPSDMLFAFCVRRLRKRFFPEVLIGAIDSGEMDSATVVDVGTVVERLQPGEQAMPPCAHLDAENVPCMAITELIPGRSGGMFLRCTEGHMMPPPQSVRDLIRGHREGVAAIQQGESDADGAAPDADGLAEEAGAAAPDERGDALDVQPQGAEGTAPAQVNAAPGLDAGFAEAAGIAPQPSAEAAVAPAPVMTRAEADEAVQAILSALTAARKHPAHLAACRSILDAHGYDGSPLTSWLFAHQEELPNLRGALADDEGALPL